MMSLSKTYTVGALVKIRQALKERNKTLVSANGCFDLLHIGHVRYLQEARALGDCLLVAVNTDASVREIKGAGHPVVPQNERVEMLAALACVDFLILFDELTPVKLIATLQPDIHCKGGDYSFGKQVPEIEVIAAYGGQFRILSLTPEHSTTLMIEEIVRRFG